MCMDVVRALVRGFLPVFGEGYSMSKESIKRNDERREYEPTELVELPGVGTRIEPWLARVSGGSFEELATAPAIDVLGVDGISERKLFSIKRALERLLDIEEAFTEWHVFAKQTDRELSNVTRPDVPSTPYYCEVGNGILQLPESTSDEPVLLDESADVPVFTRVETDYNPGVDTTKVDEFLEEVIATQPERDTLMELVGNSLAPHGDYPYIGVLYGTGGNGKSVTQRTIIEMIGDRFTAMRVDQLGTSGAGRHIDGALLNSAAHIGDPETVDGELLATLTDTTQSNPVTTSVEDDPTANTTQLLFGTNHEPVPPAGLLDVPERWVPIEFPYQFVTDPEESYEKQKNTRMSKFCEREEVQEAFLLKAIQGYARLSENNTVSLPGTPQERIEEYKDIAKQDLTYHDPQELKYRHL